MHPSDKKILFSTFLNQVVNGGDFEVLERIIHPQFEGRFPTAADPVKSIAGIKEWVEKIRSAFPDINTLIEGNWMVCEDDSHHVGPGRIAERLACYVVLRGTHQGDYAGAVASGRFVAWQQVHLVEFREGLISADTVISDRLAFYSALGAIEVPIDIVGALPIAELI